MQYQRDFTIGVRETQDFYVTLMLNKWRGGLLGFGAVGALTAWLYTGAAGAALSGAVKLLLVLAAAVVTVAAVAAGMLLSTRGRVAAQIRRSGRGSYIQQTEINGFGVHVTVEKEKAKLGFERLHRVQETRKAFYLYLADNQAWLLPKAQMDGPEEARQLRELFRTVIESRRLQLKKS